MPLEPGTRLGAYEILTPIGAGGMGEVYRARDTRLDRDVAIKVLPPHLSEDPAALARFEREAKAVAALSHPNILAIFDFGSERGTAYAVMELLDGRTLRDTLGTPVPARKAVDYAVQIARGLAAAHGKGIVHRDVKPENVFVTNDGRVKILDFGLARQTHAFASADLTALPTLQRHTDPGTVLGTVGYMSPEQVRGEPGDHRSDIFSFGAVLYELVSGRRAFQRGTAAETMTAILNEDPASLPEGVASEVSPGLARVVLHCLEKNPAERFQSASDVAFALEALSGVSTSAARAVVAPTRPPRWLVVAAAVALLAVVGAAAFLTGRSTATSQQPVSFTPLTYQPQMIYRALLAPDGKTIVFSAALKGTSVELFALSAEYPEPRNLGLRDVQLLSISSKNELAVLTGARFLGHRLFAGTLARMPLGGGAPREILENVREADWAPDGASLAIIRDVNGRDRLEFPIGKVLYETSGYVSDLRVSPSGDRVAFMDHPIQFDDRGGVAVVDLAGKKSTLSDGYWGLEGLAWSRDGGEVLFSAGLSYAQFKVYGVTVSSRRVRQVLESAGGLTLYDTSADGRWLAARDDVARVMMVRPPGARDETNLSWLDFSASISMAPDGRALLFTEESGVVGNNYAVCLRKTDGSPVVRLGEGFAMDLSPDGKWALANVPGTREQLMLYPTGAGESRRLESGGIEHYSSGSWFADGKRVLVCGSEPGRAERCYVQDVGGGPPRPVTPEDTHRGFISPDGNLVLVRRGAGASAVLELDPLTGGAPRSVPGVTRDDDVIRWNRDGRSLLVNHRSIPARIERVDVQSGRRDLLRMVGPANPVGVMSIGGITMADDPDVYAYTVNQQLSRLFLVQGAR